MREMKFRAWDGRYKHKVMRDVAYIDWVNEEIRFACHCGGDLVRGYPTDIMHLDDNNMELIQYTGLKDKNGKEIYFDCSIITDGMSTTVVKWNSWSLLDDIENGVGDWEIIGNIYENPELMK